MLLWTMSPCSDKYVVLKEIQHSSVSQNQMDFQKGVPEYVSDTWEEVLVEVAAYSVSAQFNRCASEGVLLGSWQDRKRETSAK